LKFSKELPGFDVSPDKRSQTKYINVLETSAFDVVDSAGLSDTTGYLTDLANTIGLEKALHNASSIRMLIMIQESTILDD
jgi:hypothetical protein